MKAFDVRINGRRVCIAGLPQFGVLSAILTGRRLRKSNGVRKRDDKTWTFDVNVGGLHDPEDQVKEFVTWLQADLKLGDRLTLKVIDTDSVDEPVSRQRETKLAEIELKRNHLQNLKAQVVELAEELEAFDRSAKSK